MFQLKKNPGERWLEIGGGSLPVTFPTCRGGRDVAVDVRVCHNVIGEQVTDFTWDCSQLPLPIQDTEFDGCVMIFCLEHVPYGIIPALLKELNRVIKPEGSVVFALPNHAAQFKWIQENQEGWDGKGLFEAANELLYGTQNYNENFHCSFFTPSVIQKLLIDAGFESVTVMPYNPRSTDMLVRASKPDHYDETTLNIEQAREFRKLLSPLASGSVGSGNLSLKVCPKCGGGVSVVSGSLFTETLEGIFHRHCHEEDAARIKMAMLGDPNVEKPQGVIEMEACRCVGPGGVVCTRVKGHEGKHGAEVM